MIATFAEEAPPTIAWMKRFGLRFEALPTQFLTRSQPRLLPVGGGAALVEALATAAEKAGATFLYQATASALDVDDAGTVRGLHYRDRDGRLAHIAADAVVLACGGFQGNAEMMAQYVGPRASHLRPVARGGYFNKGEGIRMAFEAGAAPCGDFGDYHAEPVDPRSGIAEPSVFIFSYGILVNTLGHRFVDEAPTTVDACYERITRTIFQQPGGLAWCILDARHLDIPNYRLGLRTDQPPVVADTVEELADRIEVDAEALAATLVAYNGACRAAEGAPYKPLELDGLATAGIRPVKSNWAHPVNRPPFHAYPIISSNVFTYGGLKVDSHARVLDHDGRPLAGLYAAGEIIGSYYRNYPGGTSVLKGAVFGRQAGRHATGQHGNA